VSPQYATALPPLAAPLVAALPPPTFVDVPVLDEPPAAALEPPAAFAGGGRSGTSLVAPVDPDADFSSPSPMTPVSPVQAAATAAQPSAASAAHSANERPSCSTHEE
jgi:hypothetical protein